MMPNQGCAEALATAACTVGRRVLRRRVQARRLSVRCSTIGLGRYAADERFFTSSYVRGDLTVPVNGGLYRYGVCGFETSTYNATN
jgi:hypothetical protein